MTKSKNLARILMAYPSVQLLDDLIFSQEPDSIWEEGENRGSVLELIEDNKVQSKVRFNALLVVAFKDKAGFSQLNPGIKAEILADARTDEFFDYDEHWGRLWEGNDVGILGQWLVDCGEAAVPSLLKLFENEKEKTTYYGSEEATIMAMKHYRVKDFAAFYVAKIKGYDLPFELDLGKRDQAIEKMREELGLR